MPPNTCLICSSNPQAPESVLCRECSSSLPRADRIAAFNAWQLQSILIRLDHLPDGASEVSQLAKAIENLTRLIKGPMDELDDVIGDLAKLIAHVERNIDTDDEEPWRESL